MYNTLEEKMEKTDYSSRYTVYNDIQMASELKEYDSKIATEQKKLNDYIDRWYEKFSQMEVALGKLNSKESSISSLFGWSVGVSFSGFKYAWSKWRKKEIEIYEPVRTVQ